MKEYTWEDVEDYLNENLDKKFDYSNSAYTNNGRCMCLMASFFYDKGIDFCMVSYKGFDAINNLTDECVAKIKNPPVNRIGEIHIDENGGVIEDGAGIKERLNRFIENGV